MGAVPIANFTSKRPQRLHRYSYVVISSLRTPVGAGQPQYLRHPRKGNTTSFLFRISQETSSESTCQVFTPRDPDLVACHVSHNWTTRNWIWGTSYSCGRIRSRGNCNDLPRQLTQYVTDHVTAVLLPCPVQGLGWDSPAERPDGAHISFRQGRYVASPGTDDVARPSREAFPGDRNGGKFRCGRGAAPPGRPAQAICARRDRRGRGSRRLRPVCGGVAMADR